MKVFVSADIEGGHAYGIDTCWYNSNGRSPTSSLPITHTIKSLREMIE